MPLKVKLLEYAINEAVPLSVLRSSARLFIIDSKSRNCCNQDDN